jgi:hypothetical protein
MTERDRKEAGQATDEARKADQARPEKDKDAVAATTHRDNVNPLAYSKESARKPGDITVHSVNEPGPGAPKAFKVPEDHTETTPEALERAYPDGYRGHEEVDLGGMNHPALKPEDVDDDFDIDHINDPDELEDELDQAKEEGDFKSMHRRRQPSHSKKK